MASCAYFPSTAALLSIFVTACLLSSVAVSKLGVFQLSKAARAAAPTFIGEWRIGTANESSLGWTVIHAPSVARRMDRARALAILNGRSLLFVGDSLTSHGTSSLVQLLTTGSWVLPLPSEPSQDNYKPVGKLVRAMVTAAARSQYSDCAKGGGLTTAAQAVHSFIHPCTEHPEIPHPGTRISYTAWRGPFNFTDEDTAVSGVRDCILEPFSRSLQPVGAQHESRSCSATSDCVHRFSKDRCDERHVFCLAAAPAIARLLEDLQPDALILNNGIWYNVYTNSSVPPVPTVDALAGVIRSAMARRAGSARPLRVVWKTTTAARERRRHVTPESQAVLVSALVAAGAEILDAYSFTSGLVANVTLADAAYYDVTHVGPAVHAEINAALLELLEDGWR